LGIEVYTTRVTQDKEGRQNNMEVVARRGNVLRFEGFNDEVEEFACNVYSNS